MAGFEYQTSIFDGLERMRPDEKTMAVCHGSGIEGGRVRIYAAAVNMDAASLARFLKEEYGTGGFTTESGFASYDSKGLKVSYWKNGNGGYREDTQLTWLQVAVLVRQCISTGIYLYPAERARVERIRGRNNGRLPMPYPRMKFD